MTSDELPPGLPDRASKGPDPFAAGYLDGSRAARVDVLNDVGSELRRFDCVISDDLELQPVDGSPGPRLKPEVRPAHPGDARYVAGFERGYDDALDVLHDALHGKLRENGLHLASSGRVMTREMVDAIVDLIRDWMAPVRAETIDDGALHCLLDAEERRSLGFDPPREYDAAADLAGSGTLDEESDEDGADEDGGDVDDESPSGRREDLRHLMLRLLSALPLERRPGILDEKAEKAARAATEAESPAGGVESRNPEPMIFKGRRDARRPEGIWTMLRSVIHRRKALVCFVCGAATALLAFVPFLGDAASPAPPTTPSRIQPPGWVAPTHWNLRAPLVRDRYLLVDQWVYVEEQNSTVPAPTVILAIQAVMAMTGPTADMPKQIAARYLYDTTRVDYVPALVTALDPANASVSTRRQVLLTVMRCWTLAGRKALRAPILVALESYRSSGLETDHHTLTLLNRAVTTVQH